MDTNHIFILLVLVGLFLMGAEIFVPGGVLGVIGGMALLAAVVAGFVAFGPQGGMLAAMIILVFLGLSIVLWMHFLPKTRLGKTLTLSTDSAGYKSAATSLRDMVGKTGVAITPLGPSGLIKIDGMRVDAVAEGKWIDSGAQVRVIHVTGNHITVREVAAPPVAETEAA